MNLNGISKSLKMSKNIKQRPENTSKVLILSLRSSAKTQLNLQKHINLVKISVNLKNFKKTSVETPKYLKTPQNTSKQCKIIEKN
jgi:hypothetical protein